MSMLLKIFPDNIYKKGPNKAGCVCAHHGPLFPIVKTLAVMCTPTSQPPVLFIVTLAASDQPPKNTDIIGWVTYKSAVKSFIFSDNDPCRHLVQRHPPP